MDWAKLAETLLKFLALIGIYRAGRKAAEGDQAREEADARADQAEVVAGLSGLDDDGRANSMREGF